MLEQQNRPGEQEQADTSELVELVDNNEQMLIENSEQVLTENRKKRIENENRKEQQLQTDTKLPVPYRRTKEPYRKLLGISLAMMEDEKCDGRRSAVPQLLHLGR